MNEKTYLNHLSNIRKLYHEDTDAHLQFYNALLDAQLFLLLNEEPQEDALLPQIKDIESNRYVLVFDNEDRLVDFCGNVAPYAAVSGRVLIEMLEGQEIGLAFNLNVKAAEALLPKDVGMRFQPCRALAYTHLVLIGRARREMHVICRVVKSHYKGILILLDCYLPCRKLKGLPIKW